jgi:F-type H+-transporting ATPase subunit b
VNTLLSPVAFLLAAEGGHAETFLGLPAVLWKTANLLLFFGLVWWLLRKPFRNFFGERRAEIEKALAKAAEDRARAEALAAQLADRLARIETELANLKAGAQADAEAERQALLREAEAEAARIVERTTGEIESRVRHARTELTGYAGDLALELARDLLARQVTPEDQKRLVADGVAALSKAKA